MLTRTEPASERGGVSAQHCRSPSLVSLNISRGPPATPRQPTGESLSQRPLPKASPVPTVARRAP